jgi:hypothetical protein
MPLVANYTAAQMLDHGEHQRKDYIVQAAGAEDPLVIRHQQLQHYWHSASTPGAAAMMITRHDHDHAAAAAAAATAHVDFWGLDLSVGTR